MFLLWPPVISNTLPGRRVPPGAFLKTDKSLISLWLYTCAVLRKQQPTRRTRALFSLNLVTSMVNVHGVFRSRILSHGIDIIMGFFYICIYINVAREKRKGEVVCREREREVLF